jgi:Tfp pilus assembly protein PilN
MSAQKRKESINLLPEKGFESTTTGRILAWILTTFRVIVIVTEMIVMAAFLSRFWLDAQNSDLNEKIQQKQAVLSASQNFEQEFNATQKRLKVFSSLIAGQINSHKSSSEIVESLPADVVLTNMSIKKDSIVISGSTPNEKSIQQLIVNLNSKENFKDFSISNISTSLSNNTLLDFVITGNFI